MKQDSSDESPKAEDPEGSDRGFAPAEYIKSARTLLRNGQQKKAYSVLLQAMAFYPENPIILSYCGWLQAVIDKKNHSGIATCRRAFVTFKAADSHTSGIVYPILYLNLGRAFLAAGRKKDAFENFEKGLRHDRANGELKKEMQHLGMRKKPLLPFLSRSNPLNKFIGLLTHKSPHSRTLSV